MLSLLSDMPVSFTNSLSGIDARIVVFCAVVLPIVVLFAVAVYLLFRPLPHDKLLSPFYAIARRAQDLGVVVFSVVTAYLLDGALKNYYHVLRPSVFNLDLHALIVETDFGFPSGHATCFAALAVALMFINRKAGLWASLAALVIGVARVMAGVHTPGDILGGYLLGASVSLIIGFVIEHIESRPARAA